MSRGSALFTRERVRNYPIIFLTLSVITWLGYILAGDFPILAGGQPFLPDFLAHWTGGRMILEGNLDDLYDPGVQSRLQDSEVPGVKALSWFVGPPHSAYMYIPFAALPYGVSAALFLALNLTLLVVAARLIRPLAEGFIKENFSLFLLVCAASPAVFEAMGSGQDSIVALVIWLVGLRLLVNGRDLHAGWVLALGAFKPQLFVLVPVLFVAQRRWRALASFILCSAVLLSVTLIAVGLSGIVDWFEALSSPLYGDRVQEGQAWKMQSVSALVHAVPGADIFAYVVFAVAVVAVYIYGSRGTPDPVRDFAILALITIVASPHVVLYDAVLLLPVFAWAFSVLPVERLWWPVFAVFVLQWTTPFRHLVAAVVDPVAPIVDASWVAVPLVIVLVRVLRETESGEVPAPRAAG